ncbi:MAG: hypothetical protein ACE5KT_11795 [Methanosarcinales archaeon]
MDETEAALASILKRKFSDLSTVDAVIAAIAMHRDMRLISTDRSGIQSNLWILTQSTYN